jgi:hypothetical protein
LEEQWKRFYIKKCPPVNTAMRGMPGVTPAEYISTGSALPRLLKQEK